MDKLKKIFRDRSRSRSRRSSGETRRSHDVARTTDADTPTPSVQRSGISSPDDAFPSPSANRGRADSAARKPLPPNSKARISLEQENYARNSAAAHDASLQSSHATRLPIAEEFTSPSRYATAQTTVTLGNASAADNAAASSRLNGDTAPLHSGHETTLPIRNPKTRTDLSTDTPVNNFSRKSLDTSRATSQATSRMASGQQFDGKYDREAAYTPNLTSGEIPVSPSGAHARNVSTGTHARNVSTGAASIDKPLPNTPSTTAVKPTPQVVPSHFGAHGGEPLPGHLAPSLVIPKQYEYNVVRPGPQQLYTQPYVVEKAASKPSLDGIVDLTNTTDTTVEERWAPTVIHEVVFPHQHNIREERITREFHNHHIHHRMQPVIDVRVLPSFHFAATSDGRLERIPAPVGSLAGRTPNWVIAETVSRHDPAFHPGRALPALTAGHTVNPRHPTAGWPRPFTARTFAPGEGDHKEYVNEHGVLTTETTWIHPPRLAQAAYHAGETLPLDFHVPSGREREVAGYLEAAP